MPWPTVLLRLSIAALCGGIIGYQRELTDRPAGFRTHVMVSVGSALFMLVSLHHFSGVVDHSRIAAQVVTGIGFLGAGTIIRQGNIVFGLTTAASLWSVAAVGLAAGLGYYPAAFIGTLIILAALTIFKNIEKKMVSREHRLIRMVTKIDKLSAAQIQDILRRNGVVVEGVEWEKSADGRLSLKLALILSRRYGADDLFNDFMAREGVEKISWEL